MSTRHSFRACDIAVPEAGQEERKNKKGICTPFPISKAGVGFDNASRCRITMAHGAHELAISTRALKLPSALASLSEIIAKQLIYQRIMNIVIDKLSNSSHLHDMDSKLLSYRRSHSKLPGPSSSRNEEKWLNAKLHSSFESSRF